MAELTTLYRLYDEEGWLLYIGITGRGITRLHGHARGPACWWRAVRSATFQHFSSRERAEEAEREAIRTEFPFENVMHNGAIARARQQAEGQVAEEQVPVPDPLAPLAEDPRIMFTKGDVADLLGIARSELEQHIAAGRVQVANLSRRTYRVPRGEVERLLVEAATPVDEPQEEEEGCGCSCHADSGTDSDTGVV